MSDPHQILREAVEKNGEFGPAVYAALDLCPDQECAECSRIICPSHDPLHFHHDGCPSCDTWMGEA